MTLPFVFPNWDVQKSQDWATRYVCWQAIVLTLAFVAMLFNSMYGQKSSFATVISVAFIISNIALAIGTLLFKHFQNFVVMQQWSEA
jgi:hypothetical protein